MNRADYMIEFWVSVLRETPAGEKDACTLETLNENATWVRLRGVWLFEGDWESVLPEEHVECLGEIIVPALGDMSDVRLAKLVDARMPGLPVVRA